MTTFTHRITDMNGLHARNALVFARMASEYQSRIRLGTEEKMVDGKSVMALMGLNAKRGTKLIFKIEGEDEAEAVSALQALAIEIL